MTKGKIITVSVSVELLEDTEKDLHTELTGLANEAMCALLATIPEAQSRSVGWRVESLEDIGIHKNPRRRIHVRSRQRNVQTHAFEPKVLGEGLDAHYAVTKAGLVRCAVCGDVSLSPIHETANDKSQ